MSIAHLLTQKKRAGCLDQLAGDSRMLYVGLLFRCLKTASRVTSHTANSRPWQEERCRFRHIRVLLLCAGDLSSQSFGLERIDCETIDCEVKAAYTASGELSRNSPVGSGSQFVSLNVNV